MALDNAEALKNLQEQKIQIESQLESLRVTYFKVLGAIDALEQIEASKIESEEEVVEEE